MNLEKRMKFLVGRLNMARPRLLELDRYWSGEQPAAFMSDKSREALGNRLQKMSVNFPRVSVTSLAERLDITGFHVAGNADPDTELWKIWRRNRMADGAAQAHLDALVYGRSYALVWVDEAGQPTITVESPLQVIAAHDPVTRRVTAALKRWVDEDDNARAVLYTADKIRHMAAGRTLDLAVFPETGWTVTETIDNPLGVVPVVPIVNRGRLLDTEGVSEMRDILGLSDALNKIMGDALVTSEHYARPKRWVTGLEIVEDEDGNVVDPFGNDAARMFQSESPDTKFGQFEGADLKGYGDLASVITQQIGALTGLPPHYLGLHGSEPASSDAIYAAEAGLVQHSMELQRTFGSAWADVMRLVIAVRDGADPLSVDVETDWANPQTRTAAAAADAAAKLAGIGVPLAVLLEDQLGYTPEQARLIMDTINRDRITAQGLDMSKLLQSEPAEVVADDNAA